MNDKDIANAYLESLTAELGAAGLLPAPQRPDGFGVTILEFMRGRHVTEGPARKALRDAEKAGLLVHHKMQTGMGACSLVYCRPMEWPPKG